MSDTARVIPFYAHPHVHVKINDNSFYEEVTGTPSPTIDLPYSTVVVTGADMGIDNTFVKLSDLNTKLQMFGAGNFKKYGQSSLQADMLFNGSTNVWFCRVLPDNATYANLILLAHYRKGDVLDDLDQPTGLKRLEIKFSVRYAARPAMTLGATTESDIDTIAKSLTTVVPDAQTGYMTMPLAYFRSTGRGRYGNQYAIQIARDDGAEKEFTVKMYKFGVVANSNGISRVTNIISGSLYQQSRNGASTLVDDVIDQYSTGSSPIDIHSYEDNFETLYDFYQSIVNENLAYAQSAAVSEEDLAAIQTAKAVKLATFDPLFGFVMATRSDEVIPFYQNYTVKESGEYVAPDLEVPTAARIPRNTANWNTVEAGSSVLVLADENNGGYRWRYTVTSVDEDTGNIVYDDGVEASVDDDQYDGINLNNSKGISFSGGSDGDFQQITVNGVTRAPTVAEMKLMLAREQVKAFHGEKDKKILSPMQMDLDFIFDANYNMTSDADLQMDTSIQALYSNSTSLTDSDYNQLTVLGSNAYVGDLSNLNVKKAMYEVNRFRNRNGNKFAEDHGAGCHLYLDSGTIGTKSTNVSEEVLDAITMFTDIQGRDVSIDLGSYEIIDPYSGRKIRVTTSYSIAANLVNHIRANGLVKPYTNTFTQIYAIVAGGTQIENMGRMIRGSFQPVLDLIDYDVKEILYTNRINYWLTEDEGRVTYRGAQNTRQLDASALLEESNCRVLNVLKKGLDRACRGYLYDWNDATARKGYTDAQMDIYRPWIGSYVKTLSIEFTATEEEEKTMIMHCYVKVSFRGIVKRIVLEVDINP